jgi:hypothetical protein
MHCITNRVQELFYFWDSVQEVFIFWTVSSFWILAHNFAYN